jgi:D-alanine-D-alanine ligase
MKRKLRVAILFGGQSAEHEISLISARNIVQAMDKKKYAIVPIAIDKRGRWFYDQRGRLLHDSETAAVPLQRGDNALALSPGFATTSLVRLSPRPALQKVDVVFPVLHGPFGEDGTVQGLLKLANVPFVGAGVLGSAVGMDKDVTKRLLREAKVPVARFLVFEKGAKLDWNKVRREVGSPLFVKPANLGSSVGISKVKNQSELRRAVDEAFRFDHKILVEEYIRGREIECSVLGNDKPLASLPGEIVTRHEFYSYDAKYIDDNGARLIVPANLPKTVSRQIQDLALRSFKVLCCEGMARVDFFLRGEDEIFVNEINTIPGFTQISMYPKMWEASGVSYSDLIDRLIQLALARFARDKRLRTSI